MMILKKYLVILDMIFQDLHYLIFSNKNKKRKLIIIMKQKNDILVIFLIAINKILKNKEKNS